jgi:hypothetical protein
MSTPLQRARTKLRVMYRLQQAAAAQHEQDGTIEEGHEPGSPVVNGAAAEHPQVGKQTPGTTDAHLSQRRAVSAWNCFSFSASPAALGHY